MLKDLWDGKLPLVKVFWLYEILCRQIILRAAMGAMASAEQPTVKPVLFIWIVVGVPIIVGLWRSAGQYEGAKIWRYTIRIYTCLAGINLIYAVGSLLGIN